MLNKKAIGPVVAVALLLVVTVVAVVSFQTWFSGFQSGLNTEVEQRSQDASGGINIEFISSDGIIYVTNTGTGNVSMSTIKIGNADCNLNRDLTPGVNPIDLSFCLNSSQNLNEIKLITENGIFQEKIYIEDLSLNVSTSISCKTDLDYDNYISSSCASYPMDILIFEGYIDISEEYDSSSVDFTCMFNDDKSGCTTNFIDEGCGSGTVLDAGTGLCWTKSFNTGGQKNWTNAQNYCSNLNLGDYASGWNLPSRMEFDTIMDLSRLSPSIIGGQNGIFTDALSSNYWTDTTSSFNVNFAWVISGANAVHTNAYSKSTSTIYVVCARRYI